MFARTPLGHGVGLRTRHYGHFLEHPPSASPDGEWVGRAWGADWFEVVSENFFEPGGRPWVVLEKVRAAAPVVLHGVSLCIGDVDPTPPDYLASLVKLARRIEPAMVSDHLCWGGHGGEYSHDLLPLPYTEEALAHVVQKVGVVQEALGRRILLENVSSYVTFEASTIPEWEFLNEVARRADCGILLDVNNVYVSAANHGFDPNVYVDAIDPARIGQVHLAGHTDKGTFLFDTHVGPVPEPVWPLYRRTVRRAGAVPTLVEWDEQVPELVTVVAESRRARTIEAEELRDA